MERIVKDVVVANKKGIHARPAASFVQLIDQLGVTVLVQKDQEKINGKSIMGLLTLGAQCGTVLKLTVEGPGAQEAMQKIEVFFSKQEEEFNS